MLKVNSSRLLSSIAELGEIGATEDGGVTRLCLSSDEIEAKKYVLNLMKQTGLQTYVDSVANVVGVLASGSSLKTVMSGSHVDTVINGGRYDGSYGVLAAIEAIRRIKEAGVELNRPLAAVCFTNEEGVRFPSMIGSKYMSGALQVQEANAMKDREGVTFQQALSDSLNLEANENLRPTEEGWPIKAYVELHIEQGPVLDGAGIKIGVVDSIVGILQYDVSVHGSADHAGTVPMNARKDALIAGAEIISKVNKLAHENGLLGTVGFLDISPNVPNVVPAEVALTVDFRQNSTEILESVKEKFLDFISHLGNRFNVQLVVRPRTYLAPTRMSPRIISTVESAADKLGLTWRMMQSGAGHDAMNIAKIAETGMIFVPSKDGKSHCPNEATDAEDIINGANVLTNALEGLAKEEDYIEQQ